jgi:hypothetical protein
MKVSSIDYRELELEVSPDTHALAEAIRSRSDGSTITRAAPARIATAERATLRIETFENLTGDASFDFVGRLAATEIAQGLSETRLVELIEPMRSDDDDRSLLVAGSFHLVDDSWNLAATVSTPDGGRRVASISNVTSRRERPGEAARELSRRVSGAVAGHLEPRVASWAGVVTEPPNFDAHRAHLLGMEMHLRGQYRTAIAHFFRAADADAGFTVPMLWAIQASCNLEEFEQAAAIHEELVTHRTQLSAAEQLGCDYWAGSPAIAGQHSGFFVASRSSFRIQRFSSNSVARRCCSTIRATRSRYSSGSIRRRGGCRRGHRTGGDSPRRITSSAIIDSRRQPRNALDVNIPNLSRR